MDTFEESYAKDAIRSLLLDGTEALNRSGLTYLGLPGGRALDIIKLDGILKNVICVDDKESVLDEARRAISNLRLKQRKFVPARLWEYFLLQQGVKEQTRWADLTASLQHKLVKMICAQECAVKGKTTFKEEFVTAGGIKLNEVDPNTMMSKRMPGLFFAGEILDVDGVTGGFNFQHAWTSGWIAATFIAEHR